MHTRLIIAATDGSEGADRAIDMAAALAKATAAKLLIITVGNRFVRKSVKESVKELSRAEGGDLGDAIDLVAGQILQAARERALRGGAASVETQFQWGDPAEALIATAHRLKADAIIVGRRGRGRLEGLALGSVSQKLVSLAPCAVVVVP